MKQVKKQVKMKISITVLPCFRVSLGAIVAAILILFALQNTNAEELSANAGDGNFVHKNRELIL